MNALEIVQQAQELGISLVIQGDRILYTPKSRTPIEFVAALRKHKQELLRYLSQQADDAFSVPAQNPRNPGKSDFQERVENPETHHLLAWASELAEQDVVLPKPLTYVEAPLRTITTVRVSRYAAIYLRTMLLAQSNKRTGGRGTFTHDWWQRQEQEAIQALLALRGAMHAQGGQEAES
jgi:hypothetical protein